MVLENAELFQRRNIMHSTLFSRDTESQPKAIDAWVKDRIIYVKLTDYRIISFLVERFAFLKNATDAQLKKIALHLNGFALLWEELDEVITVKDILEGQYQLA